MAKWLDKLFGLPEMDDSDDFNMDEIEKELAEMQKEFEQNLESIGNKKDIELEDSFQESPSEDDFDNEFYDELQEDDDEDFWEDEDSQEYSVEDIEEERLKFQHKVKETMRAVTEEIEELQAQFKKARTLEQKGEIVKKMNEARNKLYNIE